MLTMENLTLESINELWSVKTQFEIFGIQNKGFIKEGFDADFTIVDMNKTD